MKGSISLAVDSIGLKEIPSYDVVMHDHTDWIKESQVNASLLYKDKWNDDNVKIKQHLGVLSRIAKFPENEEVIDSTCVLYLIGLFILLLLYILEG